MSPSEAPSVAALQERLARVYVGVVQFSSVYNIRGFEELGVETEPAWAQEGVTASASRISSLTCAFSRSGANRCFRRAHC